MSANVDLDGGPVPVLGPGGEPGRGREPVALGAGSATAIMLVMVRRPGAHTQPVSRSVKIAKLGAWNRPRVSSSNATKSFTGPVALHPVAG